MSSNTFTLGTKSVNRLGYGAMQLAGPGVFGPPRDRRVKWFTEFGHLNRGDMLTSEQHRCHNEKKKFQRRV